MAKPTSSEFHPTKEIRSVNKRTIRRTTGFIGAAAVTAGLMWTGVGMTGAFFQDTEQGHLQATTGEVDIAVDGTTPLSQSFGPLMPGEQGDTNTYNISNVGTGAVDYYLASANWDAASSPASGATANPGSSITSGVVTLDSNAGPTSYEWSDLAVPVANGDVISFEYNTSDVNCGGGVPRVFIQGGLYNTFDGNPDQCGTAPDAEGWRTVTGTVSGIVDGTAGYTGIVNDNPADPGTILVRNLTIGSNPSITGGAFDLCAAGNQDLEVRVNSATHDTGFQNLCTLPATPILIAEDVPAQNNRSVDVTLRLKDAATNLWANKVGTADLIVIATQANQLPTAQADQAPNHA
jgi:hypothetical protein